MRKAARRPLPPFRVYLCESSEKVARAPSLQPLHAFVVPGAGLVLTAELPMGHSDKKILVTFGVLDAPAFDLALRKVDYPKLLEEQAQARRDGRYIGVGFSTYIEACGLAPSHIVGSLGAQAGLFGS